MNLNKTGLTLVEILLALAVGGILISLAFYLQIFGVRSFHTGISQASIQQSARFIDEVLRREIRNAYLIGDSVGGKIIKLEDNRFYYDYNQDKYLQIDGIVGIRVHNTHDSNMLEYEITGADNGFILTNRILLNNVDDNLEAFDVELSEGEKLYYGFATLEAYFTFDSGTGVITHFHPKGENNDLPRMWNVVIPESIGGVAVIQIGESDAWDEDGAPFYSWGTGDQCRDIHSIVIPDSVTEIGRRAFQDNETLTSLEMSNNIERIGLGAFRNTNLSTISILNDGVTIEKNAFSLNPIDIITIGSNAVIADDAFSIYLNETVKTGRFISEYEIHGAGTYEWDGTDWSF